MSKEILKKYNIKAKKSLWQNFLVNDNIVEQIATEIDIKWKHRGLTLILSFDWKIDR